MEIPKIGFAKSLVEPTDIAVPEVKRTLGSLGMPGPECPVLPTIVSASLGKFPPPGLPTFQRPRRSFAENSLSNWSNFRGAGHRRCGACIQLCPLWNNKLISITRLMWDLLLREPETPFTKQLHWITSEWPTNQECTPVCGHLRVSRYQSGKISYKHTSGPGQFAGFARSPERHRVALKNRFRLRQRGRLSYTRMLQWHHRDG